MITWKVRIINILANSGQWFVIPYAGSAIAQVPSLEIATFTMIIGLIMSASREGLDFTREQFKNENN